MKRFSLLVLLAATLLTACVTANAIKLGTAEYPPVPPEQVQVFMTEKDIKVPFDKIAVIDVNGGSDSTDDALMIKVARDKAGEIGANGIILGEFTEPSTAEKVVHALVGGNIANKKGKLVAIRLKQ